MNKPSLVAVAAATLVATPSLSLADSDLLVYFGTYTDTTSKGIYVAGFNSTTGKLEQPTLAAEAHDPSFVAIHPSHSYLYAVNENGGQILSYSITDATGKLKPLNSQPSGGGGPCHVSLDATSKVLLVANYNTGHVASFPILADGSIGPIATDHLQGPASHATGRQNEPHAHSFNMDRGNRFAVACDLGCDKIFSYRLDPATAKLTPNDPAFVNAPAGGGPRHLAFAPSGKFAYANNEMACTLTSYAYDGEKGILTPMESRSTLPKGVAVIPDYSTAETLMHPTAKAVYVANRGHDTIAFFAIAPSGQAEFVGAFPAHVKTPRNFGIDPSGRWMIVAGQDSDTVAVFSVDPDLGVPMFTGQIVKLPKPVCVRFMKK